MMSSSGAGCMASLSFACCIFTVMASTAPNVTVPSLGTLNGVSSVNGEDVDAFLGIPYAKAPVGNLRWQETEAVQAWGTMDTKTFASSCPGAGAGCTPPGLDPAEFESEDCLYMNIYRPQTGSDTQKKLPVYVWIHGGAFQTGCAMQFRMDRFVAAAAAEGRPVIGVTINYRLGVFGFLGSDELRGGDGDVSTGNFGLQDQRMALEFVNKYIKHWGGNPKKVTVAGQSAGAASVGAHMVMPKSSGNFENGKLFKAAVAQSGLAALWGAKPLRMAEEIFASVKDLVNCIDLTCMKQKDTASLIGAASQFLPIPYFKYLPFSPVIDGVELTAHPWELMRDKKAMKVDVLTGSNRDEFAYILLQPIVGDMILHSTDAQEADFDRLLAPYMRENKTEADLTKLKCLYAKEAHDYPAELATSGLSYWWWAAMRALSDHEFTCPSRRGSMWLAGASSKKVYNYMFVHPTETTSFVFPLWTGADAYLAPHSLELLYTFDCAFSVLGCDFTVASEVQLAKDVTSAWAEFAEKRKLGGPWKQQSSKKKKERTLLLDVAKPTGEGFQLEKKLRGAECDFWDELLEATYEGN